MIVQSEISQLQKRQILYSPSYIKLSTVVKVREAESRMIVDRAGEKVGVGNCCSVEIQLHFGKMRKFSRFAVQ